MPTVSRFPGIVIAVNYGDQPPPHFHVRYGEHRAMIGIEGLQVLRGQLPLRVLGLMIGWAFENATELNRNWELAERRQPLAPIPPWSELWFRK